MAIIRWDPFQTVSELQEKINQAFEESFGRNQNGSGTAVCTWKPSVDIYRRQDCIVICTDLPGVKKEGVAVEIRDNLITISGKKVLDPAVPDDQYFRKERPFGKFNRAFTLETPIDVQQVRAVFKDGVLIIKIPRPVKEQTKKIEVTVE